MPDFNSGNKKEPSWFSSLGSRSKAEPTSENQKAGENTKNTTITESSFLENPISQKSTNQKASIGEFDNLNNLRNTSEQTRVGKSFSDKIDGLKKGDPAESSLIMQDQSNFVKKELPGKTMDRDRQPQPDKKRGGTVGNDNVGSLLGGFNLFGKESQINNHNSKLFGLPKFGPASAGPTMQGQTMPKSFGNSSKNKVVSITYEEIGLFPRSFSRVFDRFFKQIFSDVENLVIQEYRFYRYLFLTTIKTLCILFFVPLFVNFIAKTYLIRPITEYYWNTQQTEIFLNSYEQKRAFAELHDFEEKLYFELFLGQEASWQQNQSLLVSKNMQSSASISVKPSDSDILVNRTHLSNFRQQVNQTGFEEFNPSSKQSYSNLSQKDPEWSGPTIQDPLAKVGFSIGNIQTPIQNKAALLATTMQGGSSSLDLVSQTSLFDSNLALTDKERGSLDETQRQLRLEQEGKIDQQATIANVNKSLQNSKYLQGTNMWSQTNPLPNTPSINKVAVQSNYDVQSASYTAEDQTAQSMVTNLQDKILELAIRYNNHSIEAITNFFADFLSLISLFYLLVSLEIQINITKSFLLEVFFGLDDSKKSLLILIMTDLLVGYHSSNLWELFFQFIFNHYGIPESQTGIFLLVATLPVLLDVLFKYLIFRHLNRSSPATVATYHAIIE